VNNITFLLSIRTYYLYKSLTYLFTICY